MDERSKKLDTEDHVAEFRRYFLKKSGVWPDSPLAPSAWWAHRPSDAEAKPTDGWAVVPPDRVHAKIWAPVRCGAGLAVIWGHPLATAPAADIGCGPSARGGAPARGLVSRSRCSHTEISRPSRARTQGYRRVIWPALTISSVSSRDLRRSAGEGRFGSRYSNALSTESMALPIPRAARSSSFRLVSPASAYRLASRNAVAASIAGRVFI
jgi:hypothetical protein